MTTPTPDEVANRALEDALKEAAEELTGEASLEDMQRNFACAGGSVEEIEKVTDDIYKAAGEKLQKRIESN